MPTVTNPAKLPRSRGSGTNGWQGESALQVESLHG